MVSSYKILFRYFTVRRLSLIFLLVAFIGIAILPGRSLLALYFQTAGGKRIGEVTRLPQYSNISPFICGMDNLQTQQGDLTSIVEAAIKDLQLSIGINPKNSHSYLLLGRAYCLLNLPEQAVEYYYTYIKLRPRNPLGKLEYLFASEKAEAAHRTESMDSLEGWVEAGLGIEEFLVLATMSFRAGDFEQSTKWNSYAAALAGNDISVLNYFDLDEDLLIFENFLSTNNWEVCSWCINSPGQFEVHNGILEMSYENNLEERDIFTYRLRPSVPIDQFSKMAVLLRGELGTRFTVELVIDGQRSRPISYQPVPEMWSEIEFPIDGLILEGIYLSIGEPQSKPAIANQYRVFIDWIALKK
jgi:tetratricopeptide (TPR) repeat protein